MEPRLLRRIDMDDLRGDDPPAKKVARLLALKPCDAVTYSHIGQFEDELLEIRKQGIEVYRGHNILNSHHDAPDWKGSFIKFMFDLCEEHSLWCCDRQGQRMTFNYYDHGWVYNWSLFTQQHMNAIGEFILQKSGGPWYRLDQCWPGLFPWFFEQRHINVAGYSPRRWRENVEHLIAMLQPDVILNGWHNWDRYGYAMEYENAETIRGGSLFWSWLRRWSRSAGRGLFDLSGTIHDPRVQSALSVWLRYGGLIECTGGEELNLIAWTMKSATEYSTDDATWSKG